MIQRLRGNKGFTLIELMIVVAIIGILAAIAIPNFVSMQLRSKRAELPTNLDGIRTAEKAYEAEWDAFTACAAAPSTGVPGKSQVNFGPTFGDGSDWDLMGWLADGQVRGQYQVTVTTGSAVTQNFSASARADVDGDSTTSAYGCDRNVKPQMVTPNSTY